MQVYNWKEFVSNNDNFDVGSAVTIGSFDGPHAGHLVLFEHVLSIETYIKGVITFNEPPKAVHRPNDFSGLISTLNLRLSYLDSLGFDFAVVIDFSDEFGKMKGTDFLSIVTKSCVLQYLVIGSDFKCGYKLDTDKTVIKDFADKNGIELSVIEPVMYCGSRISSSGVRKAVAENNTSLAAHLLGRPYQLDVSMLLWSIVKREHEKISVIAENRLEQIVPDAGKYDVYVIDAGKRRFSAVLFTDFDFLRLEIPSEVLVQSIRIIEFI